MNEPSILITGASTGIGRECALQLDGMGYRVYAGVRQPSDYKALGQGMSPRFSPIFLDVAKPEQIAEAVGIVKSQSGGFGLSGLVNNAGIGVVGPIELVPIDMWRRQFEVNVFGAAAVTQAFLPLLRQGRGRIVNIGSIAGKSSMPFGGPYNASKFALEALTDSLRVELRPWRISVSIVEPGAVKTPIWEKSQKEAEAFFAQVDEEKMQLYKDPLAVFLRLAKEAEKNAVPPAIVANAVIHALTARRPKARYLIGADAKKRTLLERLPTSWRDRFLERYFR
ncbi:MAG: SDR family oxidoreductase [Candidatus Omnitrophota bacterium]